MKKSSKILKIMLVAISALALLCALTLSVIASPTVKIIYKYGDFVYEERVEAGATLRPYTPSLNSGEQFFGWVDGKGTLYPANTDTSFAGDTVLYLAYGCTVSNAEELNNAISKGYTYVQLANDIRLDSALTLNDGIFVLDTNKSTLFISSEGDGVLGGDTGVRITGGGSVVHTTPSDATGVVTSSFVSLSPKASFNTLFFYVDAGTTVKTGSDLVKINTNIERYDSAFSANLYGNVSCNRLLVTNGISNGSISVFDGAVITTPCEYFMEDTSASNKERLASLSIFGGTFNLDRLAGYAKDYKKYQCAITGGTFSEDIARCFPDGNYKFSLLVASGAYRFTSCAHNGPIVGGMPESCTEKNVTLTYKCAYCNTDYTKTFNDGIGHTMVTAIDTPLIANEEITQAGVYKHYCQKCDEVTSYETFYPSPDEVYVTVKILDLKGKVKEIRVKSTDLYTFDSSVKTQANSFSTEIVQYRYNVTQENIISVEVPLGTTVIHGDFSHDSGVGLFCENPHLKEVVLPESIISVRKYAFHDMPKLERIVGLENITGEIGSHAFAQKHTNVFMDHIFINARTIDDYAFENFCMNAITFGSSVTAVRKGAFKLDTTKAEPAKEVFFENYNVAGASTVANAMRIMGKSYDGTEQQFRNNYIVYRKHQCDVTVHKPTCYEQGYTEYICRFCDYELIDDIKPKTTHDFRDVTVPPTCLTQGYDVNMCIHCGDETPGTKNVNVKRDPNAHDFTFGKGYLYVNTATGEVFENGSICIHPYCEVSKCKCGALKYEDAKPNTMVIPDPDKGHTFDAEHKVTIKEANCGDYGIEEYTCTTCGEKQRSSTPPTKDTHKMDSGTVLKEATCAETGIIQYKCTVCSSYNKKQVVPLDDDNHQWNEGVVLREPTEMVSGIMEITCIRCGYSFTEGINKLPTEAEFPTWAIIVIIVGSILVVGGVVLTLYFTLFKKKRASDSYKYKFNTLGK